MQVVDSIYDAHSKLHLGPISNPFYSNKSNFFIFFCETFMKHRFLLTYMLAFMHLIFPLNRSDVYPLKTRRMEIMERKNYGMEIMKEEG